ncbi:hypothetical protein BGZ47_004747, partial [Haplosporangium gracile]
AGAADADFFIDRISTATWYLPQTVLKSPPANGGLHWMVEDGVISVDEYKTTDFEEEEDNHPLCRP